MHTSVEQNCHNSWFSVVVFLLVRWILMYTVSGKKQMFFLVIPFIKLGQFWLNLVRNFINKFAAKLYKRFPPRKKNISVSFLIRSHRIKGEGGATDESRPCEIIPGDATAVETMNYRPWRVGMCRSRRHRGTTTRAKVWPLRCCAAAGRHAAAFPSEQSVTKIHVMNNFYSP